MKLTSKNYFSTDNDYISTSKLKDFARSKAYFYEKHIRRSIEKKMTPALLLGSMVDDYVTKGPKAMSDNYRVVLRRNLKNPPDGYVEVTQAQWNEALAIGEKIRASAAFKEIKKYRKQVVLQINKPVGEFPGLCGMLDFLLVDGSEATIVDLKTSSTIDPQKYYYHCLDYKYHWQMAMYKRLVLANWSQVTDVTCKHLVIEKDADNINNMATFVFDNSLIEVGEQETQELIDMLAAEKKFIDEPVTFERAHLLTKKGVMRVEELPV